MRYDIQPRDIPPAMAARRLGISLSDFKEVLPNLLARGFPRADPDTGHFDLVAIDRWCDSRHFYLFGEGPAMRARDASTVAKGRIEAMRRGTG
jgi:hypothetical protein